ncbi:MAG: rRNA pseudouridine synthase [Candidatus Aureabacteria bacterium]|nr:rRNA pseudouridine synthase [Candidatus Auribacterota bacterium]
MTESLRLQKFLAAAGIAARRKCEEFIALGFVSVNGEKITEPGLKINPEKDIVLFKGKKVLPEKKIYYILNKPKGYVCSCSRKDRSLIVIDLIPGKKIFPVGRLDKGTEGLLILTNDGDVTQKIIHPSKKVVKSYYVVIDRKISLADTDKIRKGVKIDEKITLSAVVTPSGSAKNKLTVEITEGRNRQIRKIFEAVGYKIVYLKRKSIGKLSLCGLQTGEYKEISRDFLCRKIPISFKNA